MPKPTNWARTYLSKDKSPFGCFAIYNLMDNVYSKGYLINNKTLYNLNTDSSKKTSIIIIDDKLNFNKNDVKAIFKFLDRGNTAFISVNQFNGAFADTFHLKTSYDYSDYNVSIDSLINKAGAKIRLEAQNFKNKPFLYSGVAVSSYFKEFDTTRFKVLAQFSKNRVCLISTNVGKGKLYLMTMPDVFGNYFVVDNPNRFLVYAILSLLKNDVLIWDEYYKTYNVSNYSFIKFILENDSLYAAYLLIIIVLIFYMIFEGRRRQRAIPIVETPKNSTLEFVNVVSHVYYNSKNHQSIAAEKIRFFYETVRAKFQVNTNKINGEFLNEISTLSGIEIKMVKQLFTYCEKLREPIEITENELIELNRQIHNFNKNSLR
ncbi:DUF4350 domain-containing protein [Sediminibacterium sp.]|uniref:DUF4350 domain-containing protein n=1 Tax=Sediminibacterium sp. TaxID=1917865 RepID=UPI0027366F98|nr:DUF4350 domain-containing protein [Sediminibacterium sp.]MDP3567279.1 hypothetical protein [Sediminibacterium sp.]